MDKKRSAHAAASRYRALVSASANIDRSLGSHSKAIRQDYPPRYDPEKEAAKALELALKQKDLRYYTMFRYATGTDILLMIFGVICAIIWACVVPITLCAIGKWVEIVLDYQYCTNEPHQNATMLVVAKGRVAKKFHAEVWKYAITLCIVIFLSSALSTGAFSVAAENQTFRIRLSYFESVLRKDMAWLDNYVQREFGRHMTHDVTILRNGLGGRIPYVIYAITVVPALLYTAFVTHWLVTLVTVSVLVPSMVTAGHLSYYFEQKELEVEDELSDKAEGYAEQVLSNIKAVKLYNAEAYEHERYGLIVSDVRRLWKYILYTGSCIFFLWAVYYFASALTLYFGRQMIAKEYLQFGCHQHKKIESITLPIFRVHGGGAIFVIFMAVGLATLHSLELVTIISMLLNTKKVAAEVFFMIDWKPRIDNMSSSGECPGSNAVGKIEFRDVSFKYPRKMEVKALKNVNLTIQLGRLVAILGDSGSGKSTVLRLIHRLYDPTEGYIYFDGRRMDALNIGWLRSQIGHVQQKPVLFNKTVEENVRFGNWLAERPEVEEACKIAGIHDDILLLPKGYKTIVGQRGKLLSLEQRRRIAFARAYLQRPKVLLLDEPVGDGDKNYEESMLATINQLRRNTTVVITSSNVNSIVRQCDRIYVIDRGSILQEGNHATLLESDGLYSMLEHGIGHGILAERKLRLTSQLKAYNFAKTLRKWRLNRDKQGKDVDTDSEDANFQLAGKQEDDNVYEYQRKTREKTLILGGFNSYHYARRNAEAYDLRHDDKGVKKSRNIGGLAILKHRITKIKHRQISTGIRVVENKGVSGASDSRSSDIESMMHLDSQLAKSKYFARESIARESIASAVDQENTIEPDDETGSVQSDAEHNSFWDEYKTTLENLDEDRAEKSWKNIFSVGFHGWWWFLLAVLFSGSLGYCSTLCHNIYGSFYEEITHSVTLLRSKSLSPSIANFLISGVVAGLLGFAQHLVFTLGTFKLTAMLKVKLFKKLLEQDLEWFDLPENDISIICHRLSNDTAAIERALMITFGVICQSFVGTFSAITIVLIYTVKNSDQLSVYAAIGIPMSLVFVAVLYIDGVYQVAWNQVLDNLLVPVTEMEVDVVVNIRTVITIGLEEHFLSEMTKVLKRVEWKIFWENVYRTIVFGLSRVFPYLIYIALALNMLANNDHRDVITWHVILFSELLIQNINRAGIGLAMLPNTESARAAATRIRNIFERSASLQEMNSLTTAVSEKCPVLKVRDLNYTSPENISSLIGINFEVQPNGFLGIVGIGPDSGSSMLINILARFYKPSSGSILMNGVNIWSLDLTTFRSQTGFVEESPSIFDMSIRDNITYGLDTDKIGIEQIIKVAMEMKIHDLIIRLPQGYDTNASSIGRDDRSCGLLQRLVMARALIRKPKVLFVDGHTTSINQVEDALLQDALEYSGRGRTKIVATERISTIKNADYIIVLQDGQITEQGTHNDLIENKRLYHQMHMYQQTVSGITSEDKVLLETGQKGIKRRSLNAYERYLQKRMFPQVPRVTQYNPNG